MEQKARTIFKITDELLAARRAEDKETERARTLEYIDHVLTKKETDCPNLNRTGQQVFRKPLYKWQNFSPSCPSCNIEAISRLTKWRDSFLPPKPEILIPELWDHKAGEILVDPIGQEATIKGFTPDRTAVILVHGEKEIRLTKTELATYKPKIEHTPEQPVVDPPKEAAAPIAQDAQEAPPVEQEAKTPEQPATGKKKAPKAPK